MLAQNQMDASVLGIGQLITQRKRLRIPPHQREFSWTREVVQEFVKDVLRAAEQTTPYFIGMVVLQGPSDSAWTVLDGQQRLVTVSLIYSCIASWLERSGKQEDAKQLRDDYLHVRQLGGETGPRLRVSEDLADVYNGLVLSQAGTPTQQEQSAAEPGSSEQKLLEAVTVINELVAYWIEEKGDAAGRAYTLATMLERDVTVAALDVRDERSAFVIFETLNDRGITLTAWDLVRNHVLKECGSKNTQLIKNTWRNILSHIAERDADDFLKVAWTAAFGRVQKGDLFDKIRARYNGETGALELVAHLDATAEIYSALSRPDHQYWSRRREVRHLIGIIDVLGNRQLRPAIISAVQKFDGSVLVGVLEFYVDLLVRYVVGRRRTGALEIGAARIAKKIYAGEIRCRQDCEMELGSLWVHDVDFILDIQRFVDHKEERILYLAAALESGRRSVPLDLFGVPISSVPKGVRDDTADTDFMIDPAHGEPEVGGNSRILSALADKPLLFLIHSRAMDAARIWKARP